MPFHDGRHDGFQILVLEDKNVFAGGRNVLCEYVKDKYSLVLTGANFSKIV